MVYFLLFLYLDKASLLMWDESRLAVNAAEGVLEGQVFVPHFQGKPDMWNTKPPLMVWLQMLSIRALGFGELAIRLPSALAALFTVFALIFFSRKWLQSPLEGAFAGLVLLSTPGYMYYHGARHGDYDALLTLFSFLYVSCFATAVWSAPGRKRNSYLLAGFVFVTLAGLTKGIAGFFFTPVIFGLILLNRQLPAILRNPVTYSGLGILIIGIGGYYLLREQWNPGFLQKVWANELGGRFGSTLDQHQHPFFFFFIQLWKSDFTYWLFWLPLSGLAAWKHLHRRRLWLLMVVLSLFLLLLISWSGTKLEWYEIPAYPFLAMSVAIGIGSLLRHWNPSDQADHPRLSILLLLPFSLAIFGWPVTQMIRHHYFYSHDLATHRDLRPGNFMKRYPSEGDFAIIAWQYDAVTEFYEWKSKAEGTQIRRYRTNGYHELQTGQRLLVCREKDKRDIEERFVTRPLKYYDHCWLMELTEPR